MSRFPTLRLQRLRQSGEFRALFQETHLRIDDLIMPVFINETLEHAQPISSMPGIFQQSFKTLLNEIDTIVALGINAIMLFGIPKEKDEQGSQAYAPNGVVQRAIQTIKAQHPELIIIADCCLCEYTSEGHCGVVLSDTLHSEKTLEALAKTAVTYAQSGVDIVAPSGMMDGMIQAIRQGLDQAGYPMVAIMSYAVKYASAFYGPFREAADSPFQGNRKHHQMNPAQRQEAFREAELDIEEGADILMVKPASMYLDIVRDLKEKVSLPLAVYHVSGEYAMIKAAAQKGWLQEQDAVHEVLLSMKRAGADLIVTYFAKDIATWI